MANSEKKYGLIDPKKKMTVADVFNNESDSDNDRGLKRDLSSKKKDDVREMKKQTMIDMNRALEQDPTVYQYDEVYDSIKKKEKEAVPVKTERKAKYMDALLKTAERRKKENERRTERLVQREREAEGETFKDKEEFITSAYRQKLEEMKKADEEEKKMAYIESIMDVTKQQDLGSFYRQLYKETVPEEVSQNEALPAKKEDMPLEKINENEEQHSVDDVKKGSSSSGSSGSDSSSDTSSSSDSSSAEDEQVERKDDRQAESVNEKVLGSINSTNKVLEDGEIASATEEEKKIEIKHSDPGPTTDTALKFSSSGRKDRTYRKREPSVKESEAEKESDKDHSRDRPSKYERDERSHSHRNDRTRNRDRGRDRERERDRIRRDDRRGAVWRTEDRLRDSNDSRRQRSRSRSRSRRDRSPRRNHDRSDMKRSGNRSTLVDNSKREKSARVHHGDKELKAECKVVEQKSNATKCDNLTPQIGDEQSDFKPPMPVKKRNDEESHNKENVDEIAIRENIWKKRTVGAVYDAALQRYLTRKSRIL